MKNMPNETAYNDTPASGSICDQVTRQLVMDYCDELYKRMEENHALRASLEAELHLVICGIIDTVEKIINALLPNIEAAIGKLLEEIAALPYIPKRELPRPPRYLGPVNKANYTANRPHRRARSNCYTRRRAIQ